ncbi:hypothetical protein PUN28_019320 [Cardiocondyla obscurior]|uniref:Uncharacterized protein n=1 Tax=Cardiocondyla obscurior TaxID=286306 RepID=A0AAW2ED16_9HYME
MQTRTNLVSFFYRLLVVTVIGVAIACVDAQPMAGLSEPEETTSSDIQLQKYADFVRNYYYTFGKARHGKRNNALPMMELNATWKTLKMIQDAQKQNKKQRQGNIRQNKEQILLRDFPSSDVDEYTPYDATLSGSLPDVMNKYYNDIQ